MKPQDSFPKANFRVAAAVVLLGFICTSDRTCKRHLLIYFQVSFVVGKTLKQSEEKTRMTIKTREEVKEEKTERVYSVSNQRREKRLINERHQHQDLFCKSLLLLTLPLTQALHLPPARLNCRPFSPSCLSCFSLSHKIFECEIKVSFKLPRCVQLRAVEFCHENDSRVTSDARCC